MNPDSALMGKLDKVAVVLGDENMLVPLLYSLPASVGALNITMDIPVRIIQRRF
jgi:hypothetical protein